MIQRIDPSTAIVIARKGPSRRTVFSSTRRGKAPRRSDNAAALLLFCRNCQGPFGSTASMRGD
jgi:hypothetical protein